MKTSITADFETLMHQAAESAADYLVAAVRHIDNELGEGYAEAHPELIGAFIQAASHDYSANCLAKVIGAALDRIAGAVLECAPL